MTSSSQLPSMADVVNQLASLASRFDQFAQSTGQWQVEHEDRHARLEAEVVRNTSNLAALQTPLQALEGLVGQVAQDGSMVASTLVARVHDIEQYAMREGTGIRARIVGLEQHLTASSSVPPLAGPPGIDPVFAALMAR